MATSASGSIRGPYGASTLITPHCGHNVLFADKHGRLWSTMFGNDGSAPFRERPGIFRVELSSNGTLVPIHAPLPPPSPPPQPAAAPSPLPGRRLGQGDAFDSAGEDERDSRCWSKNAGTNLMLAQESTAIKTRCQMRYKTIEKAKAACPTVARCGGITKDGGMECTGRGVLHYELRSGSFDHFAARPKQLISWVMGPPRQPTANATAQEVCREYARGVRAAEDVSKSSAKRAKFIQELPGGVFSRGVARPRSPQLVPPLHAIVGHGVVFEITRTTKSRRGRHGAAAAAGGGGEELPPFALLHQRIPSAWRGVAPSRRGSAVWGLGDISNTHLSGRFVHTPEALCKKALYPPAGSCDWVVALEAVWPADCARAVLRSLARLPTKGMILGSREVASAVEALGGFAIDSTATPTLAASGLDGPSLIVLRRSGAGSSGTAADPPPYQVLIPNRVDAVASLRGLARQGGKQGTWPPGTPNWLPSLVHPDSVEVSVALAQLALSNRIEGDFVETGVFTGGMSIAMMQVLAEADESRSRHFWACDSFKGLPERQQQDSLCNRPKLVPNKRCVTYHDRGEFMFPLAAFRQNVDRFGVLTQADGKFGAARMHTVEGWFNESLPPPGLSKIAFLRLDGDLYVSTRDPLKALYKMLAWGGYVFVDDYGAWAGCAKAVDDHFEEHDLSAPIRTIPRANINRDGLGDAKFGAVWWAKIGLCCGYASCAWCS